MFLSFQTFYGFLFFKCQTNLEYIKLFILCLTDENACADSQFRISSLMLNEQASLVDKNDINKIGDPYGSCLFSIKYFSSIFKHAHSLSTIFVISFIVAQRKKSLFELDLELASPMNDAWSCWSILVLFSFSFLFQPNLFNRIFLPIFGFGGWIFPGDKFISFCCYFGILI